MIGEPKYDWRHTTAPEASDLSLSITHAPARPNWDRVGETLANPSYEEYRSISKVAKSYGRRGKVLGEFEHDKPASVNLRLARQPRCLALHSVTPDSPGTK
jgi:hypothetical protein